MFFESPSSLSKNITKETENHDAVVFMMQTGQFKVRIGYEATPIASNPSQWHVQPVIWKRKKYGATAHKPRHGQKPQLRDPNISGTTLLTPNEESEG